MNHVNTIIIPILLCITFSGCEKDQEEEPQNRDYDPLKSVEITANINTDEVGGDDLRLVSYRDDDSPLKKGTFYTVVSKEAEQLLFVIDDENKTRGLTLSSPTNSGVEIMQIDAYSTAITLIFMSPGLLTTDPEGASYIIQSIESLSSFSPFKTYLAENMNSQSLNDLVLSTEYITLLSDCIDEYYQKYCIIEDGGLKEALEFKNMFHFTKLSGPQIKLENQGSRYVNVVRRDINKNGDIVNSEISVERMKGNIPITLGTGWVGSALDPTIETIEYFPATNIAYSEFWVVGMGFESIFSQIIDTPKEIKDVDKLWLESYLYYMILPMIDITGGYISASDDFLDELYDLIKFGFTAESLLENSISLEQAKTEEEIKAASINFGNAILPIVVSFAPQAIATAASTFLAGASAIIAAPNIGIFLANKYTIEMYTKFVVDTGNFPDDLTDPRDGNVYKTVKIGEQVWMAENLAYLPTVTPPSVASGSDPCYYVYDYYGSNVTDAKANDNYSIYGVLYNYPAALEVCPAEWHLPTNEEWNSLIDNLGGDIVAGGKMKEQGTIHWDSPNSGATNASGFTGLPGGEYDYSQSFSGLNRVGRWWSSTEYEEDYADGYLFYLESYSEYIKMDYAEAGYFGMSVRCIKD